MKRHESRKGFTLIELLVVIAIIALLVSILLPSLKQAKELAKAAVCKSNLRGISTALTLYAEDWQGYLPMPGYWMPTGGGGGDIGQWSPTAAILHRFPKSVYETDPDFDPAAPFWEPITTYADDAGIFYCPMDDGDPTTWAMNVTGSYGINGRMGYDYRYDLNPGGAEHLWPYNTHYTNRPELMYLYGGTTSYYISNTRSAYNRGDPPNVAARHGAAMETCHVLFHSGSIEELTWDEIGVEQGWPSNASSTIYLPWFDGMTSCDDYGWLGSP